MIMMPAGLIIFCEVGPQWFWGVGFGIFSVVGTSVGERWSDERVSVLVSWHESLDAAVLFYHGEDAGLVLE